MTHFVVAGEEDEPVSDFLLHNWAVDTGPWEPDERRLLVLNQEAKGLIAHCDAQLDIVAGEMALIEAQAMAGVGNFSYPVGKTKEVREAQATLALYTDYSYSTCREHRRYYTERRAYLLALSERLDSEVSRLRNRMEA